MGFARGLGLVGWERVEPMLLASLAGAEPRLATAIPPAPSLRWP